MARRSQPFAQEFQRLKEEGEEIVTMETTEYDLTTQTSTTGPNGTTTTLANRSHKKLNITPLQDIMITSLRQ